MNNLKIRMLPKPFVGKGLSEWDFRYFLKERALERYLNAK